MRTYHFQSFNLFIALFIISGLPAQLVENPAFDKKIDNLIKHSIPVISVEEVCLTPSKYVFLDARELEEYNVSHIPNAIYIGYDDFNISSVQDLAKDATLVVYCSIGYRSDLIGAKIMKAGYSNVYNLYGSIFEWANQGYEIVDAHEKKTLKLHTYNKKWSKWVSNLDIEKVW